MVVIDRNSIERNLGLARYLTSRTKCNLATSFEQLQLPLRAGSLMFLRIAITEFWRKSLNVLHCLFGAWIDGLWLWGATFQRDKNGHRANRGRGVKSCGPGY